MDTIRYRGKKYTLFDIDLREFGKQIAAHECLEEVLMLEDEFRDEEAERIDSMILFYVDNSITTDEEVEAFVEEHMV